ncbi:UPF0175 family protein [candidate division KSB1 bacterium]|nr:UPF0175 family protein [candidate division KSB1 bacterium]
MTESVTFEVSQDILASLKIGIYDLVQDMRLLTAVTYFRSKKLSLGKAAEFAGLNRLEFMDRLADHGVVIFDYDASALESDLKGIQSIPRGSR